MHRELFIHVHAGSTRLIAVKATLDSDHLSQHIGPIFGQVADALDHAFGALEIPIATYAESDAGMDVVVGHSAPLPAPAGTEIVDLPEVTAVCGVPLAAMTGIRASWRSPHRWIVDNVYEFDGPCRELYVRAIPDNQTDWDTELQQPVRMD